MDPAQNVTQPNSLLYERHTVDSTKLPATHKDKDRLCHANISSGDVSVAEYSMGTSESCEDSASGCRGGAGQALNIPYMQLFHHLKQKFPDLKDCDINESIQKFGLDPGRCEAELQQRAQGSLSGYYGPWGRGNTSNRSSPTTTPTRNTSLTSANIAILSPHPSLLSQVMPSSTASARSAPKPFPSKTISNSSSREASTIPLCSHSNWVPPPRVFSSVAHSSSLMPSLATTAGPAAYTPTTTLTVACSSNSSCVNNNSTENRSIFTSPSIHNGSSSARISSSEADLFHTSTTRHYIGTSVCHNVTDPLYRQYSNSSETITEESSLMGSNVPSPAPTLTFSSPQSPLVSPPLHDQCTKIPELSRLLEQLPISQDASNQQQFYQPINPFLPPWNAGNEQLPNVSLPSNAQLFPYVDNDVLYNRTQNQTVQSDRSAITVSRENNAAAMWFSSEPKHSTSDDKMTADLSEVQRRKQSRLEPVRIAPPPPVSSPANIAPAHQISRLTDPQLSGVSTPSSVPLPSHVASPTAAGLTQATPAKIDNRKGMKHVASLHFVPSPPHNAHLVACPPSKGSVELSDRSYTSVNLRLRQPSTEPQPAIDIKGSGSCLTYSTSSLDRRRGSRSSLQISIGPSGGSISAMRTNLSTALERGNTAFHVQYRADDGPDQTSSSSVGESAPQAPHTEPSKTAQTKPVPESPAQCHSSVPPSPGDDRRKSSFDDGLPSSRSRADRRSHERMNKHASRSNRYSMPAFDQSMNIDSPVSNVHPEHVLDDRLPPSSCGMPRESPLAMRNKPSARHERQSPFLPERLPYLLDDRGYNGRDSRPQSWYAAHPGPPADSTGSSQYSSRSRLHSTRRYSMPDGGQFAYLDPAEERHLRRRYRHGWYEVQGPPPSLDQPLSAEEWASGERIYVQGLLDDQRARQQRMLAVLTEGTRNRSSLQEEVSKLSLTLEESRQRGIAEANRSSKLIHDIQEENRRLQSECDRMEGDILHTGEAPDLEDTSYGASFPSPRDGPSYPFSSPSSPLPARPQHFRRDVSVGRGGVEGSQRFTPTRVAPPPPVSSSFAPAPPSAGPQLPSFESQAQEAGQSGALRWSCSRCTYDNHPDMTDCEICGAMRMPPTPHTPVGGLPRPSLVSELSTHADAL